MPSFPHPRRSAVARCGLATILALGAVAALCAQALADSASLSFTDTSGNSDPAADVPRTFTISGATSTPKTVYVKYRNPGGAACAPSAESDSGDWYGVSDSSYDYEYGSDVNGSYSLSGVKTWRGAGTYMFCIWIADSSSQGVSPITQTITFRSPTGTITGTIDPGRPEPGQTATITVTGASESPKRVYATIRGAGGAPCAQTYDADSGSSLIDGESVNGNFSVPATTKQDEAGSYLVCLWLASSSTDASPVAGPQPLSFDVGYPPTPPPPSPTGPTAECRAARQQQSAAGKNVKATKRSLLHARRRSTRRRLTRRLARQRKTLSRAKSNVRLIC
ncbi:MAG TPA: hypothetical protein VF549_10640 [Solirubrobacteraceae bacterium]|jgi:hypothetical protein